MKYIVMQCCKGYAVLMDENGGYVFAANMNYETGQTVTNPIIMSERSAQKKAPVIIKTIAAAAACVGILSVSAFSYYSENLKTCSTVRITSGTDIVMELNRSGKVLRLESDTEYGKKIIEKINFKGKDKFTTANEILKAEISEGYLSDGDTVEVYVKSDNNSDCTAMKEKLETELPELDINVNDNEPPEPADKNENPKENKPVRNPKEEDKDKTKLTDEKEPSASTLPVAPDTDKKKPELPPKKEQTTAVPVNPPADDKKPIPEPPSELVGKPLPPFDDGDIEKPENPIKPDHNGGQGGAEIPQPPQHQDDEKNPPHKKTQQNDNQPIEKSAEKNEKALLHTGASDMELLGEHNICPPHHTTLCFRLFGKA